MTTRQGPRREAEGADKGEIGLTRGERAFRTHLMVYIVTGVFLFSLNLLTSPRDWWFYWPLFFWGWALVFQALATYGAEAPNRVLAALRAVVPASPGALTRHNLRPENESSLAPFAASSFAAIHESIERLKGIAFQLPEGQVREQALRISASAERIAGVMAADRIDAATVDRFNARYLKPTESLLGRYARLSTRGVTGARETLRQVEEGNLPLIEARFNELYDQLHRGEIVDLAVASEMLDFDLPEPPIAVPGSHP